MCLMDLERLCSIISQGNRNDWRLNQRNEVRSHGQGRVNFILFSLLQSEPTDNMMDEDEEENMPIFGDDMLELMNSKSNYPMVQLFIIQAIEDLSDDERDDFYIK